MTTVALSTFRNDWYKPGRSRLVQGLWFFAGLPLLRFPLIPMSSVRRALLTLFGARLGKGIVIKPGVRVKYPWLFEAGDNCWIGEDCWIDNLARVKLGDDVCLSQGVYVCTGNHDWSDPSFGLMVQPVTFARGCWVGAKAVIGPGATVGDHAVVTAGAVVNGSIPAFEIHSGNPARYVRRRVLRTQKEKEIAQETVGHSAGI